MLQIKRHVFEVDISSCAINYLNDSSTLRKMSLFVLKHFEMVATSIARLIRGISMFEGVIF